MTVSAATPTAPRERNHPVKTADDLRGKIAQAERSLRLVWVIAFGSIVFSMLTVTPLVQHVTPDKWDWTAPILPLVVDAAVIIVVRMDAMISGFNVKGGFWPAALRWMTGLFTLALNIGDSALKGDLVGVGVHAVCPLLLIATSEAIPRYRRTIASAVDQIRRDQAAERERREQQQRAREQEQRHDREQEQARREQRERERLEGEERRVREQREHEAHLAQQAREHEARLERERREAAAAERQAEQERLERIRLAELAATERREQAQLEEQRRREQQEREERERRERAESARREQAARVAREQQAREAREHPKPKPPAVHEQRPLRAVNTPSAAPVNTQKAPSANNDKVSEEKALEMIRTAVNAGEYGVRALARETGWSPAWVSARIGELRGDAEAPTVVEGEQVSA